MAAGERWILISNCQTYGLAHCLQMQASGVTVEPVDIGQYQAETDRYNASFGDYDRVLIGPSVAALEGADFSLARRLDKLPELAFSAYHPDLTYVVDGTNVVNGPIGAYHSLIAFAAHGSGRSVVDTLRLFNGRIYQACGYLDQWDASRDNLILYCRGFGLDVSGAFGRWGRRTAFMYSFDHPRIHVLHDIARIFLKREGYEILVSDVLPHDNLAMSGVFPVYPEIGDLLGVPGSYAFKRSNAYSQIGLRQFVEESFAVYDGYAQGTLTAGPIFDRVRAALEGERVAA